MKTFHKVVLDFNQLVAQHQFLEALDYYHEEVTSADNLQPAIKGLAALQQKTQEFVENASIESMEVVSLLSEDNLSVTNWWFAFTHKTLGSLSGHRISVQRWKDNKIIQEHHFYNE